MSVRCLSAYERRLVGLIDAYEAARDAAARAPLGEFGAASRRQMGAAYALASALRAQGAGFRWGAWTYGYWAHRNLIELTRRRAAGLNTAGDKLKAKPAPKAQAKADPEVDAEVEAEYVVGEPIRRSSFAAARTGRTRPPSGGGPR